MSGKDFQFRKKPIIAFLPVFLRYSVLVINRKKIKSILVDRYVKHAHLKALKMSSKKELEKPLSSILSVMAMCNSASIGTRKFSRRVSTKRDLDKLSKERLARPPITKKFTVV
jgi:hypothetical protein